MAEEARYEITVKHTMQGGAVWNQFFVLNDGNLTPTAAAAAIIAQWCGWTKWLSTADLIFQSCRVRTVGPGSVTLLEVPITGLTGVYAGACLPAQVALIGQLRGTGHARHQKGRIYFGAIPTSAVANGQYTAGTYGADSENAFVKLRERFILTGNANFTGLRLIVYSRVHNTHHVVTSLQKATIPAIQRRRRIGVGI